MPYHGHKRLRQQEHLMANKTCIVLSQLHRSLCSYHSWRKMKQGTKWLCWRTPISKSLLKPVLPVCNAKRCGERWGWRFSSRQHLERSSSASQNTLWGALAWRCQEPKTRFELSLAKWFWKSHHLLVKSIICSRGCWHPKESITNFACLTRISWFTIGWGNVMTFGLTYETLS